MGTYKVEDLENRLSIKNLENEVIAENGKQTVIYVGEAFFLHFDDKNNIIGDAMITRYDRNGTKKKIKFSKNPLKIKIEEVPKDVKVWRVRTKWEEHYFILDRETSREYRDNLIAKAAKKNLKLSDKLLNALFDPIDEKIIKMYNGDKI